MNWYHSESATRPLETDTTSSKKYNYVRRNITEVQRTENEEIITMYEYDECKILKEDWGLYEERSDSDIKVSFDCLSPCTGTQVGWICANAGLAK